ncbi:raffinose/stachyose/melibiose transport system permease protein [Thermosporothrix hazakensis]|jgi:raffinose/stachyose/melibiose transport system permease protein|uniref:Raffinose/stachyose/melibiose transport system permease protein n=2 Tax=Thermosporothrix TaxID=768650 RepID=A0A326U6N8_THEHA|nr:carbohydrate ABC transporter permease [Thermosporothrix hazakensis]PZW28470.1 raffinose/stachyose/melibiose transport system permease protein [Thermosporothrix hazakensis]BBH86339.1 ABC transporter permease [Thermosporothrix sp. COM3]GCE45247.1 ABC transporter permease [Thermosporothrix hazakensis]
MSADIVSQQIADTQHQNQRAPRRGWWEILPFTFGIIWFLIAFFPVLYMFGTSLRPLSDYFTDIPWLPPSHPTLENYSSVLASDFGLYFMNTVFVTVFSVLLIVIVSLLSAYAISRIRNRVTQFIFNLFLVGLAIPLQATIIPIYAITINLHLYDSLYALILPSVAFGIPLSVLVLVTYIRDIPRELFEAMLIDGAGHFRILRALVLPLSRPALTTVIIYETIQVWNGFLFPLVLTQSTNVRVLPLALWNFQGQYTTNVPAIMAAVFLSATPIILLYIFGRRQLLSGLVAGFSK